MRLTALLASTAITFSTISVAAFADTKTSSSAAKKAISWGHYSEAYSIYEQALETSKPKEKAAIALKYAKAKLDAGSYVDARRIANEGLTYSPDARTEKKLKKVISSVSKKTKTHSVKGAVQVQFQSHSNIGAAPSSSFAQDEDDEFEEEEDIELDDEELEEIENSDSDADGIDDIFDEDVNDTGADAFYSKGRDADVRAITKIGMGYAYNLSDDGDSWKSAFNIAATRHDDRDELDKNNWSFTTGPEIILPDFRLKFNPSITYASLYKDSKNIMDAWVYSIDASFQATPSLELGAKYSYATNMVENPASPDSDVNGLKLGLAYDITKKDKISFAFNPKFTNSEKRTQDKGAFGYHFSYSHKFPYKITSKFDAAINETDYDSSTVDRSDEDRRIGFSVSKKFEHGFNLALGFEDKRRESNKKGKDNNDQAVILTTGVSF